MDTSFEIAVLAMWPDIGVPRQQGTVAVYDTVGVADAVDRAMGLWMVSMASDIEWVAVVSVR